jgi:hypothetical protein
MVRPEAGGDTDEVELDEGDEGDEGDEALEGEVVATAGSSPGPPHAVRHNARASPAAYENGARHVTLVTNRSLGNEF